jgi:hypothetical protein
MLADYVNAVDSSTDINTPPVSQAKEQAQLQSDVASTLTNVLQYIAQVPPQSLLKPKPPSPDSTDKKEDLDKLLNQLSLNPPIYDNTDSVSTKEESAAGVPILALNAPATVATPADAAISDVVKLLQQRFDSLSAETGV